MKHLTFLFMFFILANVLFAQVPQSLNYQAIARDASGKILPNQNLSLRISILDSVANGPAIYEETFSPKTNNLGLFTLNIGRGAAISGSFSNIDWGKNNKFLKIEMDSTGGSNYFDFGVTQLMSVPYALYAGKSGNKLIAGEGIQISNDSIINISPDQKITFSGNGAATITGTYPNFTIHEDSTWRLSGNNIINNNKGNVGIGTDKPLVSLDNNGDFITKGPRADIRAFGAVGDGKTDNTSAIQAAIDSITITNGHAGGVVYIPPGIYLISAPIILKDHVSLLGDGWASSIRLATGANCNMLVNDPKSKVSYLYIKDLNLYGNDVNNTHGTAISFFNNGHQLSDIHIDNVLINHFGDNGIYIEAGWHYHVTNCVIEFFGAEAIHLKPAGTVGGVSDLRRLTFSNNKIFDNNQSGNQNKDLIYLEADNAHHLSQVEFIGNMVGNNVEMQNVIHIKSVDNFIISGNSIGGGSQSAPNTYDALLIEDDGVLGSGYGIVSDNNFTNGDYIGTAKEKYGIAITGISHDITISGNQFNSIKTKDIFLDTAVTNITQNVASDANGNVGIGKAAIYKLDVKGPVNADSLMFKGLTIASIKGTGNLFVGILAGTKNTGTQNQFIGSEAGYLNSTGENNCFQGYKAGYSNLTGNNNTCIGFNSNVSSGALSNATAIGNNSLVSSDSTMVFGNHNVNCWAFGLSSTKSGHALQVGSTSSNGNGAYLTTGGTWTNASDRNKKENFTILDGQDILNRICKLPITRWNYKGEQSFNTHIGPMAQDFYKEFHTGNDSLAISTIDPAGIALIGVQQLQKENEALKLKINVLEKQNEVQESKIGEMASEMDEIKNILNNNKAIDFKAVANQK